MNEFERTQELERLFYEDIQNLVDLTFTNGPVEQRNVRQASVIVRRWLCDGDLAKLGSYCSANITVPVLDDDEIIAAASADSDIEYYLSAGVKFNGIPFWSLYSSKSGEVATWASKMLEPCIRQERLGKLMKRKALFYDGTLFDFDEVLRFACNKLGGAHYSTSRNPRQSKLDEAAKFLTVGAPKAALPPDKKVGTVHLGLEGDGSEVLSGIAITVIVAATMLVNVKFDGQPLVMIKLGDE